MTKVKQVFFSEKDQEQLDLMDAINDFLKEHGYTYSNFSRRLWMHLLWGRPLPGQQTTLKPLQQVVEHIQESKPPVLAPIGTVTKKKEDKVIKWVESSKKEAPKMEPDEDEDTFDSGMPMI